MKKIIASIAYAMIALAANVASAQNIKPYPIPVGARGTIVPACVEVSAPNRNMVGANIEFYLRVGSPNAKPIYLATTQVNRFGVATLNYRIPTNTAMDNLYIQAVYNNQKQPVKSPNVIAAAFIVEGQPVRIPIGRR